jgi:hypothetical protein
MVRAPITVPMAWTLIMKMKSFTGALHGLATVVSSSFAGIHGDPSLRPLKDGRMATNHVTASSCQNAAGSGNSYLSAKAGLLRPLDGEEAGRVPVVQPVR